MHKAESPQTSPATSKRKAEYFARVARDVSKYGCHIVSVFDPEGEEPDFSYSVGVQQTSRAPEVIVLGLRAELAAFVINEYNRRVRAGKRFRRGKRYAGFLDGFPVYFEPVRASRLKEYTLGCDRFYGDETYAVMQIIYPTTKGVWPWNKTAPESFKCHQPMLGRAWPNRP
ncbi:MAG: DUF4262 domain-containing protein [Ramlibacter sp.]